jgi:NAD(P)-dependent dehydrogenase (short-subunit alcohol dehydrogenase family)
MSQLSHRSAGRAPIQSAFVLGSTSSVARAICLELARRGCRRFHLVARNPQANGLIAAELQQLGASVSTEITDLCSDAGLDPVRQAPLVGAFDLYLITAGSLGDPDLAREAAGEALRITAANYTGLLPWLTAIASAERLASPGRLWVFASVAADRGRPSNYIYAAAKAALTTFCEGLLLRSHGRPFAVRVIKAGYIATPMTAGKAPASLCVSPATIARLLLRNPNKRGIEYMPGWWRGIMLLVRRLPARLASRL